MFQCSAPPPSYAVPHYQGPQSGTITSDILRCVLMVIPRHDEHSDMKQDSGIKQMRRLKSRSILCLSCFVPRYHLRPDLAVLELTGESGSGTRLKFGRFIVRGVEN